MYSQCLFAVFVIIELCHCSWVKIGGPPDTSSNNKKIVVINRHPIDEQTLTNQKNDQDKSSSVIFAPEETPVSTPETTASFPLACCGQESTTTQPQPTGEDDCCGYLVTEKKLQKSLTDVSQENNDTEILNRIFSLIDEIPHSMQRIVDDMSFAVFIPEMSEKSDIDTVWPFREQNSNDEIDIILRHEIVNHMESESIQFKIAVLKHYSQSSFHTITKNGEKLKHGPFIIVKTTSQDEITIGTVALEFKIDRKQLEWPRRKWICMFWNNETYTWENRGIKTIKDEKYITCSSDHLSAFSVVLDPYAFSEDDGEFLTFISVLGSLLTIPCLIITIILHRHKRARRKKISSKILMNCCLSLLLLHFSFLIFNFFNETFPCWILNFLIHYGVSATLLWTAVDGINMWRKLFVDIFDKRKTVFYRWSKIISWGFPFFSSFVGVLMTDYSERNECGIYFKHNVLLYLLPCALVMICNIVFFTIMFINVVCKNKIKSLTGKKKKYVMSLVQVFGLFWCIAFPWLWMGETRLLGHIVFTILVSNQGVVIFFVRCMNEREIRKEMLEYTLYRKIFHYVLTISDEKSSFKNGKTDVTGIFAVSSGSAKCILSSAEMNTKL